MEQVKRSKEPSQFPPSHPPMAPKREADPRNSTRPGSRDNTRADPRDHTRVDPRNSTRAGSRDNTRVDPGDSTRAGYGGLGGRAPERWGSGGHPRGRHESGAERKEAKLPTNRPRLRVGEEGFEPSHPFGHTDLN